MTSQWLDAPEERAWRAYRRMFTLLDSRLGSELTEATGLSWADYTVLSNLVEVEDRRWRLTALAEYMGWSQSRLSHQVKRMEQRGLVLREQVPGDARGAHVVLSRIGLRAIAAATPTHLSGVRRHFVDLLTRDQLATLAEIGETVAGHLADPATKAEPNTPRP